MYTTSDKVLGTLILALFVLWIVLEILGFRQKVRAFFANRTEARAHTDETLAEMYTTHTYHGTRAVRRRRQRGG